jgi:hypothetical protein
MDRLPALSVELERTKSHKEAYHAMFVPQVLLFLMLAQTLLSTTPSMTA